MIKRNWHIIFPVFLAVAACLDLTLTLIVLNTTDTFYEANPIMRYSFEKLGQVGTSAVKLVLAGITSLGAWWVIKKGSRKDVWLLSTAGLLIYGLLGLWWIKCLFIYFAL
jgi:hypothetical protein